MKAPLNPAYREAVFEYIPDDKPSAFWVITAYNPDGKNATNADNIGADERLHTEITALGFTPFRIIGMSSDESRAEPGWGVPCDEASALEIGRRYRQEALFHFHDDRIELVDCECGTRHPVDVTENRIRDPRDMRHFTLFVGSHPESGKIDDRQYEDIRTRVGACFPGFTIQRAEGCFRAETEDTLLVHISTRETDKVLHLAHELRSALDQFGIGISHNGIYQRIREWTDDALIIQSFDIVASPRQLGISTKSS